MHPIGEARKTLFASDCELRSRRIKGVSWTSAVRKLFGRANTVAQDPIFGEIELQQGAWFAASSFPRAEGPIEVSVWGEDKPTDAQRTVFAGLKERYEEIEPRIAQALFDEYRALSETEECANDPTFPRLTGPDDVWSISAAVSIDIYEEGYSSSYDSRLYYSFSVDIEHGRSIFLKDRRVVQVAVE